LILIAALFAISVVNYSVIGPFWFLLKVSAIIYLMIWFRGTFARYRYDQLMNIGWKVAIPVGIGGRPGECRSRHDAAPLIHPHDH